MKKYILPLLLAMTVGVKAQSTYEVTRLLDADLSGTARFVGMGGSMGALGADLSVINTNPAGMALYRKGDVSITAGLSTLNSDAKYLGNKQSSDKTFLSFDNLGLVFVAGEYGMEDFIEGSVLKGLNFGINMKKRNDFDKEFAMSGGSGFNDKAGNWVQLSQMYQMQALYDMSQFDMNNISYTNYTDLNNYWLALLGADAGLFNDNYEPVYLPDRVCYYSEEKGGVNEVDLNISCNLNDQVYLGLSLGLYYADYSRYSYYGEDDSEGELYTLHNWYSTTGSGFDVKFGAIFRPFKYSPFKFGIAVHTPTWYSLEDVMSARIEGLENDKSTGIMDTHDYDFSYGDDFIVNYRMSTPWRLNLSASYIFGASLAVNAEYEYADYSTAKMEYDDGCNMYAMEEEFKSNMKDVHTFRIGAEYNLGNNMSLRCGYNYMTAPFNHDAGKYNISATNTSTEYLNRLETNIITLGAGYRDTSFYMDFAYQLSLQKADFYPYYDPEYENPAATVEDMKNRLVVTCGFRF